MTKDQRKQRMLKDIISVKKGVGSKEDLKPRQHNKLS